MHGITTHKTKLLETNSRFILLFRSSCFLVIALSYENKTHIFSGRAARFFGFLTKGRAPLVATSQTFLLPSLFI